MPSPPEWCATDGRLTPPGTSQADSPGGTRGKRAAAAAAAQTGGSGQTPTGGNHPRRWACWLRVQLAMAPLAATGQDDGSETGPYQVACAPCWRTRRIGARAVLAHAPCWRTKEDINPFSKQILLPHAWGDTTPQPIREGGVAAWCIGLGGRGGAWGESAALSR